MDFSYMFVWIVIHVYVLLSCHYELSHISKQSLYAYVFKTSQESNQINSIAGQTWNKINIKRHIIRYAVGRKYLFFLS